ncbi:GTPase Era [Parvibaculum sp.]|uniref:GTPase Era n=1 Tax=Parvibaculum sp. TaxID=2024848 RepID=UPI001B203902|nr:GTPase Era [Parvibaculum sp.]MBO6633431.1 GTPase Era [Parvibaculum sp.]MBO6680199.1 GTPase Era [Parvibaculum sp.]MBO6685497.1 GTPase Era [Parvibaculum sp.]
MENEHANDNGEKTAEPGITRCGFVAIIGAPNAGKSTLLNQLVGSKVAIVTHKVQTTRTRIRGIAMEGNTQIVFVDTPGIFKPKRRLDKAMVEAAWGGAGDADLILLMVDAEHERAEDLERILEGLKGQERKAILVLNKVDAAKNEKLLKLAMRLNETGVFTDTFMISALTGDGVADLRRHLAERMPQGPWHYPEDQAADVPLRSLAAEVTREKLFLRLHDELPYSLTVETEEWENRKDGSIRISQVIFVERESQKKIALGKGGQTIKTVGQLAREELQEMLETKVHLFLFVKVRENWSDDRERYREMGLDFPEG